MAGKDRSIIIIAGPNGAGKTTFAREYLPREAGIIEFINADLIAQGLSPFAPEKAAIEAGKIMLRQIRKNVDDRISFAFETTLSGLSYARLIPYWRATGYKVEIAFLSLPNVELALHRVYARVKQGGHSIPDDVIRRRYVAGMRNFDNVYRLLVDYWVFYDNSGATPVKLKSGGFYET